MKKHFTKFVLIALTIAFFGQFSTAQTVIWGGPGDKNGEFDGGLNDWTVNAVSPNDSAVWIWNAEGKADRGSFFQYAGDPAILSPSVSNGAAVFDSDYYDNGGDYSVDHQLGDGPAPSPQNSELISPAFSCEGQDVVWVQFYQFYRNYDSSPKLVVSVDGGETWGSAIEVNPDIQLKGIANGIKLVDISAFAANQSNVKIKFVWEGDYYFWIIDDVSVITAPKSDPQITGTWFPPQFYSTPQAFIAADSMYFIMEVQNKGGSDATDVLGKITLINTSTAITYYTDSMKFDISPGDTSIIEFNPYMPSTEMDTGHYAAVYDIIVDSAATDSWKRFIQFFDITANMFVDTVDDGRLYMNTFTTNDDNTETFVKIGETKEEYNVNYYRTGDWTNNDYVSVVATDVTMSLAIREQDDTLTFDTDVSVLKLADTIQSITQILGDEGLVVDNKPNPHMENVGYSSETINAPEYHEFTTPLYNGDDEKDIALDPNSKYLVVARWPTDQTYFQGFDNTHGKYTRYYFSGQFEYLLYTSDGGFSRFRGYTGGGWHMGLLLKLVVPFPASIDEEDLLPKNTVVIKENPVRDRLIVNVDFQKNIEKATMAIHDINGQIIDMRTVKDLNRGTFNFYTNNLPTGTYIFTIFTKDKLLSKKFVVAK